MKWKKIGHIFDPTQYKLVNGCISHAQSPQTLIFEDFVRIYFSTRSIDPSNNKYFSHISYIEIDKSFKDILKVSDKPVIPLGELGCFDEHGIFPINLLKHNNMLYAYTCGWSRRVSVSVETAIGVAISYDEGLSFQKIGRGPILSASTHEPCLVGDAFVKYFNETFHMWYIFGLGWKKFEENQPADRI